MISNKYIAGFFDGEGSVGIYMNGQRKNFYLRTQLVQNVNEHSLGLFRVLEDRFGGHWSYGKGKRRAANWQLSGQNAVAFLKAILPHMVLKKDQAELALKWLSTHPSPIRNSKGQMMPYQGDLKEDARVAKRLKEMKKVQR